MASYDFLCPTGCLILTPNPHACCTPIYAVHPKALQNADMRAKIEKLVAAGVLQTG